MNTNNNDYVIVNGRKYFAGGGEKIDPKVLRNIINNFYKKNNHLNTTWRSKSTYVPSTFAKSQSAGMDLFNAYPENIRNEIATRRKYWLDPIRTKYRNEIVTDENGNEWLTAADGYKINLTDWAKTDDYNDKNSQYVNGLMWKMYPGHIKGNYKKDKNGKLIKDDKGNYIESDDPMDNIRIGSGDNIFYNMLTAEPADNLSFYEENEWNDLNDFGFSDYNKDPNKHWTRRKMDNNTILYNFYTENGDGTNNSNYTLAFDPSDGTWSQYSYDQRANLGGDPSYSRSINKNTKDIRSSDWRNDYKQGNAIPIIRGNAPGLSWNSQIADDLNWTGTKTNAYGGPTTRLYAVGGTTGEQIPIGEQPEDYNMVGAGGSHEMNPQGGVPYGMNQDGSQNMVEQGEVSVGNNVFSDRTAISPELCQQLGLPEGTSPAQAMQQIEQLYEQGQIGDQEFQEIQQIIFDDQEAQKQNVGGSYQQGQVGGEGITPDMMQGQNMPPQAMLQQSAPEGIAPEMVQGGAYAFGGRRRC